MARPSSSASPASPSSEAAARSASSETVETPGGIEARDDQPHPGQERRVDVEERQLGLQVVHQTGLARALALEPGVVAIGVLPRALAGPRIRRSGARIPFETQGLVLLEGRPEERLELRHGELKDLDRLEHPRLEPHLLADALLESLSKFEARHRGPRAA